MRTTFTDRFRVDHPLVQAGMGCEAGARLAAAVSDAGALGTIGSIGGTPDHLAAEIRACRLATGRPFAVNVVTWPWVPWEDPATEINWARESAGLVDHARPAAAFVARVLEDAVQCLRAASRVLTPAS